MKWSETLISSNLWHNSMTSSGKTLHYNLWAWQEVGVSGLSSWPRCNRYHSYHQRRVRGHHSGLCTEEVRQGNVCKDTHTYKYTHTHKQTHTQTCTHTQTHIDMHLSVSVAVCVPTCLWSWCCRCPPPCCSSPALRTSPRLRSSRIGPWSPSCWIKRCDWSRPKRKSTKLQFIIWLRGSRVVVLPILPGVYVALRLLVLS